MATNKSNKRTPKRPKPMSPPGGMTKSGRRYGCGGKVKKSK